MSVYLGYQLFRRNSGRVAGCRFYSAGIHGSVNAIIDDIGGQFFIRFNVDDDLGVQVESIIHELIHIGREGFGVRWPYETVQSGIAEEDIVEGLARDTFNCQPNLVRYLAREFLNPEPKDATPKYDPYKDPAQLTFDFWGD
jgi:hypothetical protein